MSKRNRNAARKKRRKRKRMKAPLDERVLHSPLNASVERFSKLVEHGGAYVLGGGEADAGRREDMALRFTAALANQGLDASDNLPIEWSFMRESDGRVICRPRDQRVTDAMAEAFGVDHFVTDTRELELTNPDDGTPLAWEDLEPARRYKPGEHAVENYLFVCQKLIEGANDPTATRDLEDSRMGPNLEAVRMARLAWAGARDARVFEFRAEMREMLLNEEAARLMAGVENLATKGVPHPTDEQHEWFEGRCSRFHFPETRPFEHCFFGFDEPIYLPRDYWHTRIADQTHDHILRCGLVGILISPHRVWEMLYVYLRKPVKASLSTLTGANYVTDEFLVPNTVWDGREWLHPRSLNPFLVTALNDHILTHQTTVKEHRPGMNQRFKFRKVRKHTPNSHGLIPRPYYVVPIKDRVIEERERKHETGTGRQLSYRHDREGHFRTYVRRGPLPLSQKERDKWLNRGYEIFTVTTPRDPDVLHDMLKKGHAPKGRDEWLAVKRTWVDDQIVGDPSLPYIPAVRVPEEDL